jgi:hypothetical protein
MKTITINFDDVLFREPGICANSVTTRETELMVDTTPYTLRVSKRNIAGQETLFMGLYDLSDAPVQDLKVQYIGQTYGVDDADHPESVLVPLLPAAGRIDLTLTSAELDLIVAVSVQLEQAQQPDAAPEEHTAANFVTNLLNRASRTLKTCPINLSDCPEPELVLAYAYGELNADEAGKIASHVHQCLECLDMVLAARAAEAAAHESAEVLLPAWLQTPAAADNTEPYPFSFEEKMKKRYPSIEDMIQDIRNRWGRVLEWPLAAMDFLSFESALLSATFRLEILPLQAADYPGELIIAKWILLNDGDISDIRPLEVCIHRKEITENRLEISGELPTELKQIKHTLLFGWELPGGKLLNLTFMAGETRDGFFYRCLIASKMLNPTGTLKMLVMGN